MKKKIKNFSEAMYKELIANNKKGDWDKLHPLYLCAELHYHASKLYKACDEKDNKKILEYAADCGNISMMISDITGALNELFIPVVVKPLKEDNKLTINKWCKINGIYKKKGIWYNNQNERVDYSSVIIDYKEN